MACGVVPKYGNKKSGHDSTDVKASDTGMHDLVLLRGVSAASLWTSPRRIMPSELHERSPSSHHATPRIQSKQHGQHGDVSAGQNKDVSAGSKEGSPRVSADGRVV